MDLLDANILIGAFRRDDPDHRQLKEYLERRLSRGEVVTFPPLVEVAFLRIATHPKIFAHPSSFDEAARFLDAIHESEAFRESKWTARARQRWRELCRLLQLAGNDINDAYLAALAIEHGCRLVTRDGGFARFRGLGWWNPTKSP